MSIKNPLLEKYSSQNKSHLLSLSGQLQSSVLKRSSNSINDSAALLRTTKVLKPSVLSTPLALLSNKPLTSLGSSYHSSYGTAGVSQPLSSSILTSVSSPSQKHTPNVISDISNYLGQKNVSSQDEVTDFNSGQETDSTDCSPFLACENFIPTPITEKSNVINNYFDTIKDSTIKLSNEEVLKQDLINLAACSLISVPKLDNRNDEVRNKLIDLSEKVIKTDPEFLLKMALFTRRVLNIRVTANFLLAFAAYKKECRKYIKKYYNETVVLPSDWIDVAELYTSLGDKNIGFSALPVCLRKAMAIKFPKFDTYQIGKYNKKPKKNSKKGSETDDDEDDDTKLYERHHFTLKQLIRKIHISDPPDTVMPILGKKYPETQEQFYRSRLSGLWDENQAGKRMKVPTPYTWETQLAAKGNNSDTWKELILSRKLPYMAMLRNLRNIIQSGVSDNIHKIVQKKLSSPEDVKRSKQFPFRFLSAYAVLDSLDAQPGKSISWSTTPDFEQEKIIDSYKACLDKAVQLAAMNNVKPIKGALLLMFDCSDDMDEQCSAKGFGLTRTIREVAGLMTLMCMYSSEHCDIAFYNRNGVTVGEKIETGGEILKFLSTFVSNSKVANELLVNSTESMSLGDFWSTVTNTERHYDTIIQISPVCNDFSSSRRLYREKVNSEVLAVDINLKSKRTYLADDTTVHRNDVKLFGFSDQMLQYISERGSGELLSNVEAIDKKFNLLPLPKPMAKSYISPLAKQIKSRVVRLFVSSTFLDLEQERRDLMNLVIPEINKLIMDINFVIQEVDLRWGITKDEAASNKVILRCLEEVSRCDYFLCVIGNRYGTCFDAYPKSPNPELAWLNEEEPGLSMTHLEVIHALLHANKDKLPSKNIMFIHKTDGQGRDRRVSSLLSRIERECSMDEDLHYVSHYDSPEKPFTETALQLLKDVVVKNISEEDETTLSDDKMHNSVMDKQALLFVGREKLVSSLVSALKKDNILLVTGPVGTGKSALLAKALTMFPEDVRANDFHHAVKLNGNTKDLNILLSRLCFHLSKILNEKLEEQFEPISTFWSQIVKCESNFKIVIDGCDELLQSHDLFTWLPDKIPKNITFVFTASFPGQWSTYLNKKYSSLSTFHVPKLSATEKMQVTKEMLAAYGKKLEEKGFGSQLSLLLSKREANNPLYIDLCINQLRLNAIFENLTECIKELPQTTEELYVKILNYTVQEVYFVAKKLLAYLYCSKNGISESDILQFLQIKPLALSNLLHHLKLFINVDQSTGILSLANQLARKVVQRHCLPEEKSLTDIHRDLGNEYLLVLGGRPYTSVRKDAYQNMLFHFAEGSDWATVSSYLCDMNFVRQMIYLGLLNDIVSIFNINDTQLKGFAKSAYKNAMADLKELQQFLINNKTILSKEPFLLQQRLLLSDSNFSDTIENNSNLIFNEFVGSFKSLQPSKQIYKCNMNEHFSSQVTCLAASEITTIVLVGFHNSKFLAVDTKDSSIVQTYRGHTGPVTCCGFLTSSRLISAGSDGSLRLWSLLDPVCIAKIEPHVYPIQDIDINEITKCVISTGIDRKVTVWHNDVIFDSIEFDNPMNCIRFIENGKKFVAGSWTGEMYAYDLVQKVKITVKKSGRVHKNSIRALTTGKKQFASLDILGLVSVWDQLTLDVLQSIRLSDVTCISYDFKDRLVYGFGNGVINVASGFGEMTPVEIPDLGPVTSLHCSPDSSLYIGYYSGSVIKTLPNTKDAKLTAHKGRVNLITSFNVSIRGKISELIASCSDDGTIHVYTPNGDNMLRNKLSPHIGKIIVLCAGTTGVLFSGGYDCAITALRFEREDDDLLSVQEVKLHDHQAPVSTLLTLKEGERLISGSHDGNVKLWNKAGKCVYTASSAHHDWVTCSAAANNTALNFVTGSNDNLVVLWRLEASRIYHTHKLQGHTSPISCISVLGNNKDQIDLIMAGAQDGSLVLWNKDGKFLSSTRPGKGGVTACTFNAQSTKNPTAYVGTVDGQVKQMKPRKLDVVARFTHHTDLVRGVRGMSENQVLSISTDNTVQCWSWDQGPAHSSKLLSIADIKCSFKQNKEPSSIKTSSYKICAMDKTGAVVNWKLEEDVLTLLSETDAPKKTPKCFALIPPSAQKQQEIHVPSNEDMTRLCLASESFVVELVSDGQNNPVLSVYRHTCSEVYMKETIYSNGWITFADLTEEGFLILCNTHSAYGNMHHMHVWNLKTKKRMPSSNTWSNVHHDNFEMCSYITAGAVYDGNNIMGTVTGFIKIPVKKRKSEEKFMRVFNSAVTALECTADYNEELVIFAGSKDGVVKVLTGDLQVVGMYHTNGPVTALRLLRSSARRDSTRLVVGDKCGCVHFLKWCPPRRTEGGEGELRVVFAE